MKKFFVIALSVALLSANLNPAHAASPYLGAPTNLEALKKKITDAMVVINANGISSIGFAGEFNLSSDFQNQGYNSMVVTKHSNISKDNDVLQGCFRRGNSNEVVINYQNKTYKGECWRWNGDGYDFASIATSVKVPTLSPFDNYVPPIGGWVYVAYYLDGIGIQFAESKVRYFGKETLAIGIEKFLPIANNGGLVFNSLGNFVGSLTTFGPGTVPGDYLKVSGSPMMCQSQGSQANVMNCNTGAKTGETQQDKVWTIDSPIGVKPTPTPIPPVDDSDNTEPIEDKILVEEFPEVFLKNATLELSDYVSSENSLNLMFKSLTSKICGVKKNATFAVFYAGGVCKIRASAISDDSKITASRDIMFSFTIKANALPKVTCIKGESTAVISGKNPKCPAGFKKKAA
jgi:hypothetical protein